MHSSAQPQFAKRYQSVTEEKAGGATYTPHLLADFVADQIVTDRVINELMGKDASARFRFIMDRAEEAEELDV